MRAMPFVLLLAGAALLAAGFLLGGGYGAEGARREVAPMPSLEVDADTRLLLRSLADEVRRLRLALEEARQVPMRIDEAAAATRDPERAAARDKGGTTAAQGDGRAAAMVAVPAPDEPLIMPQSAWPETRIAEIENLDQTTLTRCHLLWTPRDVLARYGVPAHIGSREWHVQWTYRNADSTRMLFLYFRDGVVYSVQLKQL